MSNDVMIMKQQQHNEHQTPSKTLKRKEQKIKIPKL